MRSVIQGDRRGRKGAWWHDATGLYYTCTCGVSNPLDEYYIQLKTGSVFPNVTCMECTKREAICLENWKGWEK